MIFTAKFLTLSVLLFFLQVTKADDDGNCVRPLSILDAENKCLEETSSFFEKVRQKASDAIDVAKKKLGINSEQTEEDRKKCSYYLCILKKLNVVSGMDIPHKIALKNWIAENTDSINRNDLAARTNVCFNSLYSSLKSGNQFYGAFDVERSSNFNEEVEEPSLSQIKSNQTACDIASEFIQCLSWQQKCSPFKYP